MTKSTFESLPNELLLIIFSYLSLLDVHRAFHNVNNVRMKQLLTSLRRSLNVNSMRYVQMTEFLNLCEKDPNSFVGMIDTVILASSLTSNELFDSWIKKLENNASLDQWLLSTKRFFIYDVNPYAYFSLYLLLNNLITFNAALRYLHLHFKRPYQNYTSVLFRLMRHDISVHTMIFQVEQGHYGRYDNWITNLREIQPFCWRNTVELTLSVQYFHELMFLFQTNALPVIQHLNVTNEQVPIATSYQLRRSVSNNQLHKDRFYELVAETRLKSLILRYFLLDDCNTLLDSVKMPSLEKLILVDLYDNTLNHLDKFKELCCSDHLPALKHLHFSFCFPKPLADEWKMSLLNVNNGWPFDDVDCYIDEGLFNDGTVVLITEEIFVIYKRPIDILFQYKRALYNHHFLRLLSSTSTIKTEQRPSVVWYCDEIDKHDELLKSLELIANDRIDQLILENKRELANPSMAMDLSTNQCCNFIFHHLRSLTFDFDLTSKRNVQRELLLERILDSSPNLSHLVVSWENFRQCKGIYSNLRKLHLKLPRLRPLPKRHFDIDQLCALAPNICHLETSVACIVFNKYLLDFVLEIIRHFRQLAYLLLNKDGLYSSKAEKKNIFKEKFLEAGDGILFDANNIQVTLFPGDYTVIRL